MEFYYGSQNWLRHVPRVWSVYASSAFTISISLNIFLTFHQNYLLKLKLWLRCSVFRIKWNSSSLPCLTWTFMNELALLYFSSFILAFSLARILTHPVLVGYNLVCVFEYFIQRPFGASGAHHPAPIFLKNIYSSLKLRSTSEKAFCLR